MIFVIVKLLFSKLLLEIELVFDSGMFIVESPIFMIADVY